MTVLEMPARTGQQRLAALEYANEIRSHRAQVKRDLKAGQITLFDVYEDGRCDTMKIWDVLLAFPKLGRTKVNLGLNKLRIAPSKTVGGMTVRQKTDLAACVYSGDPASCWKSKCRPASDPA